MAPAEAPRPMRGCKECGGYDDHPRHVIADPINNLVVMHHMDCGAAAGCVVCQETEAANEGRRGQELIQHLDSIRGTDQDVKLAADVAALDQEAAANG